MRLMIGSAVLGLALITCATPALADGNANFVLGARSLDEDFWTPTDSQAVFGVTVDFGGPQWPVNLAIGYYSSYDKDTALVDVGPVPSTADLEGSVGELSFGVLKTWKKGNVRPFLGGGASFVEATGKFSAPGGFSDDDSSGSAGAYVEGGVYWRLARRLNIGLHARIVGGSDVTLFGVDGNADYGQFGFLVGWGWPGEK